MKAVILTGQYATGKTSLIRNMIPRAKELEGRVGALVAESANLAADRNRFGLGDDALGVSFASVCCPTLDDMTQALTTCVKDKTYDLLFIEPPGNVHALVAVGATQRLGIEVSQVMAVISNQDYKKDKANSTFNTALKTANQVGVTFTNGKPINDELISLIKERNPHAVIHNVPKEGFIYDNLKKGGVWSSDYLTGFKDSDFNQHSDHYERRVYVIDPTISLGQLEEALSNLAKTGRIERGKGHLPNIGKWIDVKRSNYAIQDHENPKTNENLGHISLMWKKDLISFGLPFSPDQIMRSIEINPERRLPEFEEQASLEDRLIAFGKLYSESLKGIPVRANGLITYTFTPVDQAYKKAQDIYRVCEDDNPIRMILPPFNSVRFKALRELDKGQKDYASVGIRLGIGLLHQLGYRDVGDGKKVYLPNLVDQGQLRTIRNNVASWFIERCSQVRPEDFEGTARFESHVAPLLYSIFTLIKDEKLADYDKLKYARDNLITLHEKMGIGEYSKKWQETRL